jgi:hypothetical protein
VGRFRRPCARLRPDHFACRGDPAEAYLKPFLLEAVDALRREIPGIPVFIEGVPNQALPPWREGDPASVVNASHWYDGMTLMTGHWQEILNIDGRTFRPAFGMRGIEKSFVRQVGWWARGADPGGGDGITESGDASERGRIIRLPAVIGEFGLPFDLDHGASFRSGNFGAQERALGAYFDAMDANLVGAAIWNYAADNRHEGGDGWNLEDLSIFCAEDGGGRALRGFLRPYPARTAGEPLHFRYDARKGRLLFEYGPIRRSKRRRSSSSRTPSSRPRRPATEPPTSTEREAVRPPRLQSWSAPARPSA